MANREMKEPKRYNFRQDSYTLQVLHTDSKYNKDKILKHLICEHYLLNNADSFRIFFTNITYLLFTRYFPYRTPILSKNVFFTINFISPLSSYAQITNVLFLVRKEYMCLPLPSLFIYSWNHTCITTTTTNIWPSSYDWIIRQTP